MCQKTWSPRDSDDTERKAREGGHSWRLERGSGKGTPPSMENSNPCPSVATKASEPPEELEGCRMLYKRRSLARLESFFKSDGSLNFNRLLGQPSTDFSSFNRGLFLGEQLEVAWTYAQRVARINDWLHWPFTYHSDDKLGALFACHIEAYHLYSLNHLHVGRKFWIVIPTQYAQALEDYLQVSRVFQKPQCAQFVPTNLSGKFGEVMSRLASSKKGPMGLPENMHPIIWRKAQGQHEQQENGGAWETKAQFWSWGLTERWDEFFSGK